MKSAIALDGTQVLKIHDLFLLHKLLEPKCSLPPLVQNEDGINSLQIISQCALDNVYESQAKISCQILKKHIVLLDPYVDSIVKYIANFSKE